MLQDKLKFRNVLLGSASPRRKQLLENLGITFSIVAINVEENYSSNLKAEEIPTFLSAKKSDAYAGPLSKEDLLITADTTVWLNGEALNKPTDATDAFKMLKSLSGKMHQVFTGVTIRTSENKITFHDETKVYFKNLSDEEIHYYINNYQPFDKAGAYGAQDWIGLIAIQKIEGSYFNVMGLPVHRLYEQLVNF